jgi:large subunit ribosomal protein L5e
MARGSSEQSAAELTFLQYRLVVRITNKQVICQVVYAKLQGDFVLCQASSKELPRYGKLLFYMPTWDAS